MKTNLATAVVGAAAFLQGCAGGGVTNSSGGLIQGNGNAQFVVEFQNASTGASYTTGVDDNGYFGFDGYAPASASNDAVVMPEATYRVWISSKNGGAIQSTPYEIYLNYNNTNCPDHYASGQTDPQCALFQLMLLGDSVVTPPTPYASSFVGFKTTVIPLAAGGWCQQARRSFGVANVSPRYNDITLQTTSSSGVTWGWKVTSGNLSASGTIPTDGYIDLAESFTGPPYYVYPNTSYTVSFYPGGLSTPCAPIKANFVTTNDPVPPCVVDHDCQVDPGDGDSGNEEGTCSPGIDCCANGYCSDPDQACDPDQDGECSD